MQELKFRAWYESTKEMVCPAPVNESGISSRLKPGQSSFSIQYDPSYEESDAVMQFSNQIDKHGKTVAAGDIVEFEYGLGVVFWSKATSCFKIRFDTGSDDLWLYCPDVNNCLKIIGNICENKDLIPSWYD